MWSQHVSFQSQRICFLSSIETELCWSPRTRTEFLFFTNDRSRRKWVSPLNCSSPCTPHRNFRLGWPMVHFIPLCRVCERQLWLKKKNTILPKGPNVSSESTLRSPDSRPSPNLEVACVRPPGWLRRRTDKKSNSDQSVYPSLSYTTPLTRGSNPGT